MALSTVVVLIVSFLFLFPIETAKAEPDCSNLNRVLTTAAESFKPLVGKPLPDDKWVAKVDVPQFGRCVIERKEQALNYGCNSGHISGDAAVVQRFKAGQTFLKRCLSKDWQVLGANSGFAFSMYNSGNLIVSLTKLPSIDFDAMRRALKNRQPMPDSKTTSGSMISLQIHRVPPKSAAKSVQKDVARKSERPLDKQALGPEFCNKLKAVMAEAPDAFRKIRGAKLDNSTWKSLKPLPGGRFCTVDLIGGDQGQPITYHSCNFSTRNDRETALLDTKAIMESLGTCLGRAWRFRVRKRSKGRLSVYVSKSEAEPSITIRLRDLRRANQWGISFDVDEPSR